MKFLVRTILNSWPTQNSGCYESLQANCKIYLQNAVSKNTDADGGDVISRYNVISVSFSGYCNLQILRDTNEDSCKTRFVFDAFRCTKMEDENDYSYVIQ